MDKKINFYLKNLIFPILGSIFLLSAIGKIYDLESFKQLINKYGFSSYFSYCIITFEIVIAISFTFFLKVKKGLIFASLFTLFITMIYIYGYLKYDIISCGCFGGIEILNPSSFHLVIIKNIFLMIFFIFGYKIIDNSLKKTLFFRFFSMLICLILFFSVIKFNYGYYSNHVNQFKGKNVSLLGLKSDVITKYNKLFFFSPNCPHCKEKIPRINQISKINDNKILGILKENFDNVKYQTLIRDSLKINFDLLFLKKEKFLNITKRIPVLMHVKNNVIYKIE
jgi:thiol-disulfide isomerase/thioredoxin